jgi:hypothetical protein
MVGLNALFDLQGWVWLGNQSMLLPLSSLCSGKMLTN